MTQCSSLVASDDWPHSSNASWSWWERSSALYTDNTPFLHNHTTPHQAHPISPFTPHHPLLHTIYPSTPSNNTLHPPHRHTIPYHHTIYFHTIIPTPPHIFPPFTPQHITSHHTLTPHHTPLHTIPYHTITSHPPHTTVTQLRTPTPYISTLSSLHHPRSFHLLHHIIHHSIPSHHTLHTPHCHTTYLHSIYFHTIITTPPTSLHLLHHITSHHITSHPNPTPYTNPHHHTTPSKHHNVISYSVKPGSH